MMDICQACAFPMYSVNIKTTRLIADRVVFLLMIVNDFSIRFL